MIKKIILGIVALVGIGFTVLVGVVFFSPMPFKLMAQGLEKEGIFIEGIEGSLNSGIRIEKLKTENAAYAIEFEGTEMRWSNFFKTFVAKKIAIELLETRKALVVVKKRELPSPPDAGEAAPQSPTPTADAPSVAGQEPSVFQSPENPTGIMEFRVDLVSLKDVTIRDENRQQEFVLQELSVRDFVSSYRRMVLQEFLVESNQFSLSVQGVTFKDDVLEVPNQLVGVLKTPFMPELLRKEIKFSFLGKIANKIPENFELKIDEDKLTLKLDDKGLSIGAKEFTPSEYFVTDFPISKLSVQASGAPLEQAKQLAIPLEGTFWVAQKSFKLDTSKAVWAASFEGTEPYKIFMAPGSLVMGAMLGSGAKGLLELSGSQKELEKNLAQLFFDKKSEELSPEQMAELQKVAYYFKDPTQPASELIPLAASTSAKTAKGRQPASLKSARGVKSTKAKKASARGRK